jgi:nucleoside-diphosphate-sugar epimerase
LKTKIGITGHKGVFGKKFINLYSNKFIFCKFDGDITKNNQVINWIKKTNFDVLIHAAAKVPVNYVEDNYKHSYNVNYKGTQNIINSLLRYKKDCYFIFLSTAQVYPFSKLKISEKKKIKPISKYGITKCLAEKYIIKKFQTNKNYILLRIFSYTDKKQSDEFFIPAIFKKIKKSKKIFTIDQLNQKRDFIHIKDLCRAINHVIKLRLKGILNIGSGQSYKLNFVVKYFCDALRKKLIFKKNNFANSSFDLIPDITKLKKSGFKPKYNIKNILNDFIF